MESRAKLFGHPIHQMLVVFPLGLLGSAVIFDIIGRLRHHGSWSFAALYMIAAGVATGLVAALFGLIDWAAIPNGTRAKKIGLYHAVGNVAVLALFALSWSLRVGHPTMPGRLAVLVGMAGAGIAAVTGWLGGELVDRLGVGVSAGAHLDAPSSLTGRPAREG
ncbi:MAG: DUF2231 domain-containing protein [Gemmatimonadaceae bacterium]